MNCALRCVALMAVLAGCRGRESPDAQAAASAAPRSDVSVTRISLGRALDRNGWVAQPVQAFAPADTVYASVVTERSARQGLLKARWTYQNSEIVSESSFYIAPSGTTTSVFHISRPEGLPPGRYQVEIFFDGASAGKRTFSVQ
jgi:hypothetical protein